MIECQPEIVAVFPFWSQANAMNWDSNFQYLRTLLPKMSELLPEWLWLFAWPQQSKGAGTWTYYNDGGGFFTDRIVPYPWPYDTAVRTGAIGFDPDRFKELDLRMAPTVYWLHQVETGLFMKGGYRQSFNESARPRIVCGHHFVIHKSLPYPLEGMLPRMWLQLGGAMAADVNVFNSQHCQNMLNETASDWLSPEAHNIIKGKEEMLRFGLLSYETDIPIADGPGKPVIVYNHRFEAYKNVEDTCVTLKELRAQGLDFEVWITQTRAQGDRDFPFDRSVGAPSRDAYLRNIAVPGINTSNSMHETFGISMLESIALGQLPVAPRAVTFPELVPPDYPYLFKTRGDQVAILRHIISRWPQDYVEWSPKLRKWAAENYSLQVYAERYAALLVKQANSWKDTNVKERTTTNIMSFLKRLPKGAYPLHRVSNEMRSYSKLGEQAMTDRRALREILQQGGKVRYVKNEIIVDWR
jgi:glycosyltransferase involved in cell wall biosynthesis